MSAHPLPTPPHRPGLRLAASALLLGSLALPALAATDKLALTGGVSSIDGAAGGGLTPWAVIGSNATAGQWGVSAFGTTVHTQDYRLHDAGIAIGWDERVELSIARQRFDTRATGTALGLPGLVLKQDIVGVKVRLAGDAVLDSDRLMPAVTIGLQTKHTDAGGLASTLQSQGASLDGTDVYLSATKLLLAQSILVNATLRATKANQNGLLGFGGNAHRRHTLQPEVSLAWLLHRTVAVGAEYRRKPDNLNPSALGAGLKEDAWTDVFVAWAPSKHFSLTAAWVDLGRIVPGVQPRRQSGAYVSGQLAF